MHFILQLKENLRQVDINLGFDVGLMTNSQVISNMLSARSDPFHCAVYLCFDQN